MEMFTETWGENKTNSYPITKMIFETMHKHRKRLEKLKISVITDYFWAAAFLFSFLCSSVFFYN